LIIAILLFSFSLKVDARDPEDPDFGYTGLTRNALEVTCIYNDGYAIKKSYDPLAGTMFAYIEEYPVRNSKPLEYNITGTKLLNITGNCNMNNCSDNGYNLGIAGKMNLSCEDTFYRWLTHERGNQNDFMLIYYHSPFLDGSNHSYSYSDCLDEEDWSAEYRVSCYLKKNNKSGWFSSLFGTNRHNVEIVPNNDQEYETVELVAERVSPLNNVEPSTSCTYAYKSKQASGANKYITINTYGSGQYYLDDGESMTSISSNFNATCNTGGKVCVKLSERDLSEATGSSQVYTFSSPRHLVKSAVGGKCTGEGYVLYEFTNSSNAGEGGESGLEQICDAIPNTAIVITRVLQWLQIIAPALVIIYTGIDIGRIVVAGNVEEELPKRKKAIIIRAIIAVAFFFIPFIIRLILGSLYGNDVGSVDCLYQDGGDSDISEVE